MKNETILRNLAVICFISIPLFFLKANAQEKDGLLWAVVKPGKKDTSFLLGTLHSFPKGVVKLPEVVIEKLSKSQTLYIEINLDWRMALKMILGSGGGYNTILLDNESWTEDDWVIIKEWFVHLKGMDEKDFDRIANQPSGRNLMELYQHLFGLEFSGIEEELKAAARNRGIPTKGLDRDWNEIKSWYEHYSKTNDYWSSGALDSLLAESFHGLADLFVSYAIQDTVSISEYEKDIEWRDGLTLVGWRNLQWMNQLPKLMQQRIFVAVGAAHIFGETGVVRLLQKAGFIVIPIEAHFGGNELERFIRRYSMNYQLQE